MDTNTKNKEQIFHRACEITEPAERLAFLDGACIGAAQLRAEIDELLKLDASMDSLLDFELTQPVQASDHVPILEKTGDAIGPYKLLQKIGEGGMGVVYLAEQLQPIKRRLALKIIKPGMDTREVIARFEAERQALAMMDHPSIAKVFDCGVTSTGRPYFVMELVKGVSVTQYCDNNHLTPRERLQLFVPICQAIQHAHQKGIIHRDIKPSNILVAEYDHRAVPKIIDFGVAKALNQQLTDKTMFTQLGQIVGTIEYMSPEQAMVNQLDVDTRSDIYSLGVLLYELLTGTTPFDQKRMHSAALDELMRIIREEEPPRPSTRLSTIDTLPSVAANRNIEPRKLSLLLHGELDWIVMKALEKDRGRRYDSATAFADDVEHYLNDESVEACPPSAMYKFQKFARRNKASLAVASGALLTLLTIAIGSTLAANRFRRLAERNATLAIEKQAALASETKAKNAARDSQRDAEIARDHEKELRTEAQRQTGIAENALADAQQQRERAEANFVLARSAVDHFLDRVTENELLTVPGMQPLRQELLAAALKFYDDLTRDDANASELLVELASAHYRIAMIFGELGQKNESQSSNLRSIELFEQLRDSGTHSIDVQLGLAKSYSRAGRHEDTLTICKEILAAAPKQAATRSLLSETFNTLAISAISSNNIELALEHHQQALALREGLVQEFPESAEFLAQLGSTLNNLGVVLSQQNKRRESLVMFERGIAYSTEAYQKAPQSIQWGRWLCIGLKNMAVRQAELGLREEALKSYERAAAIHRKLAFENPAVPVLKGELYKAWLDLGKYQRIVGESSAARRSLATAQDVMENIPHRTPEELFEVATVYGALATPAEQTIELAGLHDEAHESYADMAMQNLRKALEVGYRDAKAIQSHPDLTSLQQRADFQQLIHDLERELEAEKLATSAPDSEEQKLEERNQAARILRELIGSGSASMRHSATLACALQSVGEIQTGLKQYENAEKSLDEAFQLRRELLDKASPQTSVDLIATRCAMGIVHWRSARQREAHQIWQQSLSELADIAAIHADDVPLMRSIADIERAICDAYGQVGLWVLAAEFPLRNVQRNCIDDRKRDVWSSTLLPALGRVEDYNNYSRLFGEAFEKSTAKGEKWQPWELASLVWQCSLVSDPRVPTERLVTVAREALEKEPNTKWLQLMLAMALYRNGQYQEMLDLAQEYEWARPESPTPDRHHWMVGAYLRAMAHLAAQQLDEAHRILESAEEFYQQYCSETLDRSTCEFPPPIGENWWWLAFIQQLRREAWQQANGKPMTDDAWQHLIYARGYRLIGEADQANQHLADAAAVAGKNDVIWIAIAKLGQSEETWQKVVEASRGDLLPLTERGRWYALRGETAKANADWALARSVQDDGHPALATTPFSPSQAAICQQAWADYLQLPVQFENSIGMRFQLIPPGEFQMGTPIEARQPLVDKASKDSPLSIRDTWVQEIKSEPWVKVFLTEPVYAGQFEVTVSEFRRFVDATGYLTDGERTGIGGYANRGGWVRHPSHIWKSPAENWQLNDRQPVVHLSWRDAIAFCEWLSHQENRTYNLPTEAQWEFACRSGSQKLYQTGDDPAVLDEISWNRKSLRKLNLKFAQPVGEKKPNAFGLYDMLGNAAEWCIDDWAEGMNSELPAINPRVYNNGKFHVLRGGSWLRDYTHSRCGARNGLHVNIYGASEGFRVWLKIDPEDASQGP